MTPSTVRLGGFATLSCALALAGCAHQAARPVAAAPPATGVTGGVIVARRPAANGAEATGALLRVLVSDTSTASPVPSEFIVRTDTGATLSVVRDDGATLRVGDRVAIDGPRLTRAPSGG